MNLRQAAGFATVVLCLAAGGTMAAKQEPQGPPPPQGQRGPQRGARAGQAGPITNPSVASSDVQEVLNAWVLTRAQQQLNMTDEQYATFFPRMKQLQGLRTRHASQRRMLLNQLRLLTSPKAPPGTDDAVIAARTKAVDDLEVSMAQDEQKATALVDSGLTVWQRARFRVFEEAMENEKLRLLAKVLKTNPGGPPTAPAPAIKK